MEMERVEHKLYIFHYMSFNHFRLFYKRYGVVFIGTVKI